MFELLFQGERENLKLYLCGESEKWCGTNKGHFQATKSPAAKQGNGGRGLLATELRRWLLSLAIAIFFKKKQKPSNVF